MAEADEAWPTELRVQDGGRVLSVTFEDGAHFALAAEYLRVESPSAEVQGHGPADRKLVAGKREVRIAGAAPVGNYAVKLRFDDGHDSGLFTWRYLHELGTTHGTRWPAYLDALEAGNRSR